MFSVCCNYDVVQPIVCKRHTLYCTCWVITLSQNRAVHKHVYLLCFQHRQQCLCWMLPFFPCTLFCGVPQRSIIGFPLFFNVHCFHQETFLCSDWLSAVWFWFVFVDNAPWNQRLHRLKVSRLIHICNLSGDGRLMVQIKQLNCRLINKSKY